MTNFFYLRREDNTPHGCVAMELDTTNKTLNIAISRCHNNDQFIKSVAKAKALGRLKSKDQHIKQDFDQCLSYGLGNVFLNLFGSTSVKTHHNKEITSRGYSSEDSARFKRFVSFYKRLVDEDNDETPASQIVEGQVIAGVTGGVT